MTLTTDTNNRLKRQQQQQQQHAANRPGKHQQSDPLAAHPPNSHPHPHPHTRHNGQPGGEITTHASPQQQQIAIRRQDSQRISTERKSPERKPRRASETTNQLQCDQKQKQQQERKHSTNSLELQANSARLTSGGGNCQVRKKENSLQPAAGRLSLAGIILPELRDQKGDQTWPEVSSGKSVELGPYDYHHDDDDGAAAAKSNFGLEVVRRTTSTDSSVVGSRSGSSSSSSGSSSGSQSISDSSQSCSLDGQRRRSCCSAVASSRDSLQCCCCCCCFLAGQLASNAVVASPSADQQPTVALTSKRQPTNAEGVNRSSSSSPCCCRCVCRRRIEPAAANGLGVRLVALTADATAAEAGSSSLPTSNSVSHSSNGSAKNKLNNSTEQAPLQGADKRQIKKRLTINYDPSLQIQQEQRNSLLSMIMRRQMSEDYLQVRAGGQQPTRNSPLLPHQHQRQHSNNNNNINNNNLDNCSLKRGETINGLTTQQQINKHLNNGQKDMGEGKQEEGKISPVNRQQQQQQQPTNCRQRRRGETDLKNLINGISSSPTSSRPGEGHLSAANLDEELECSEESLEAVIVESWLDDHPRFVRDYFFRKANHRMINDWLITNAKLNNQIAGSAAHISLTDDEQQQVMTPRAHRRMTSGAACVTPIEVREMQRSGPRRLDLELDPYHEAASSCLRSHRSNSQSGGSRLSSPISMPVRKISATDFEARTGSGYLRPMVSRTPDGRPTFLSQLDVRSSPQGRDLFDKDKYITQMERERKRKKSTSVEEAKQVNAVVEHDELGLIFELVKNICNDLDVGTLLHKILKNIAVLINADKSSLFLVCGGENGGQKHLVSQLFNVDQESDENDMEQLNNQGPTISVPWGTGLVGYVAASGESINIANCYEDPRFTDTIDQQTGYVTRNMLCAPIMDNRNEIVGVAQVINKRDGHQFSKADELKFDRYLSFCGIGLRNAQSYENCQLENKRNQVILDLARIIFEEQSTIEQVVHKIILHTQSLLECERCQVLLIDDGSEDLEQLLQLPAGCSLSNNGSGSSSSSSSSSSSAVYEPPAKPKWRPHCRNSDSGAGSRGSSSCESVCEDSLHPATREPATTTTKNSTKGESSKLFSLVFDLECGGTNKDLVTHNRNSQQEQALAGRRRRFPINIGITSYVAVTGETLNIEDAHQCQRFDPSVDENSNFKHKSILCMPIRNGKRQTIGVSQLINKKNGRPFNKNDEDLFEAFSIFCGLGIHNTLMYEKVLKIMAKQRVTFEVLSYHATAPLEEAKKLHDQQIPSSYALNLTSLKFNDFSLDEQFMLKSCLRFFLDLDLMRRFQIDQLVFCNWILSVQKNYRSVTYHPVVGGNGLQASPVRYHNWRHAFNVSQMMFAILNNTKVCRALGELETLALLIACLCHDLDHRGTNNSFQIKSASPLAELYSTSTMEHHHFDQCVMILNSQGNQILANLSPEEYSKVIRLLEEAILATDLANYFQKRELFFQLVDEKQFDWKSNQTHRSLLRCMLMTACDVAAITKPWSIQKTVADLVMSEFYHQGDIEKHELHIEPSDLMNREKMSKLPEMQIGFIDSICAPIYSTFAKLFPLELKPLLDGCLANRELWHELAHSSKRADHSMEPTKETDK